MSVKSNTSNQSNASGTLYIVGTPIGNLEDMTFRAIRTLKEADWIAAEDTRQTRKLLAHYDIHTRLVSYHEHNKQASGRELIGKLVAGESIALVSDAGMPAISDPGEDLVREAIEHHIAVVPIPGPSATLSALVVSGLPTATFRFAGFLPREKKKLRQALQQLAQATETLIVYEAPHRLITTLSQMREQWGERRAVLARELTKRYEEVSRGIFTELLDQLRQQPPRGEYVIVVDGANPETVAHAEPNADWWRHLTIEQHVAHYEHEQQLPRKEAMRHAAADRGVSRREIYQALNRSSE